MATPEETIAALLDAVQRPALSQEKFAELKERIEFVQAMGK